MFIIHIACHHILIEQIEEQLLNKDFEHVTIKTTTSLVKDFIEASQKKNIKPNAFQKTFKESYQRYIYQFIDEQEEENSDQVIIFIGPSTYCYNRHQTYEYDNKIYSCPKGTFTFKADHKFHVKEDPEKIVRLIYEKEYQDHIDEMSDWFNEEDRKTKLYKSLQDNQHQTIQMMIHRFLDFFCFSQMKKRLIKCMKHYRKIGYRILPIKNIIKETRLISTKMKKIIKEKEKEKEKRL